MNFVKLYIGDYLRDTGTLTLAQHGAYTLMLLEHYATEKPLPEGRDLYRLLRAETKAEKDAIDWVAAKFWTRTEAGLINKRAAREIEKAAHQRSVNQEVGKRGGRPKETVSETESVIDKETESVSESKPIDNPNQTPDTRLKDKTKPLTPFRDSGESLEAGFAEFWQRYPRKTNKLAARTAWAKLRGDADLLTEIFSGLERAKRCEQWRKDGGQYIPHPSTWLKNRRWEDEVTDANPASNPGRQSAADRNAATIAALTGRDKPPDIFGGFAERVD
jgi:uncharacterized protein YdaU (DUF1376 family)